MKPIVIFSVMLAIVLGFSSCRKDALNDSVSINFINHAGESISHAIADNVFIGFVDKDAETGFIRFDKFGTDSGMPDCNFTGQINNDTLKSISILYWCGTEKSTLKPGKYNVEITISEIAGERYFDLQFK